MPKTNMNYKKTIIYKIVCDNVDILDCYVGQTTNFIQRKAQHKAKCNNLNSKEYNSKVYKFIRDNEGWDNWSMVEIEKYPCNDANEASKRERYYIENLQAKLNSNLPSRTPKEYKDKMKEYYLNNKDQIKEQGKEYYKNNTEKIKEQRKEYRENNKDHIKERRKKYYANNKEKLREEIQNIKI